MKLKKEFDSFHKSIKIGSEANELREKREILQRNFEDNFSDKCALEGITVNKSDLRFIDQGSYKLDTVIKSPVVDRDIAVIFPLNIVTHDDPRKLKGIAKEILEIENRRIPRIKEPCVTVAYYQNDEEWLHIDFPMYAEYNDTLYLARGKEHSINYSWEESDPEGLNKYFLDILRDNAQLRRVIRYIKKWKIECYSSSTNSHEVPPSVALTILACEHFIECREGSNYDDLTSLCKTMAKILDAFVVSYDYDGKITSATMNCSLPVTPFSEVFYKMKKSNAHGITFYKRWKKAVDNLQNACNVESEHEAAKYVQKVMGDTFDVPPKEAVQAMSTIGKRETSFG